MRILKTTFPLLLIFSILLGSCSSQNKIQDPLPLHFKPTVILVSLDGCRYDYPRLARTPNLDKIEAAGFKAEGLQTSFPSKTFPNHLSIVTGLYPEHHGIIANRIYDAEADEYYTLGGAAVREGKWYQGEPIWVTAEKQGVKTATYFWPGSEAEINGYRPSYYKAYDGTVPYSERVDKILEWLALPDAKRPQFLTLYFEEPDLSGHHFGPASTEAIAALEDVDKYLGILLDKIQTENLEEKVNVIVVSDHGMTSLNRNNVIFLDDYIDMNAVRVVDYSAVVAIRPNPEEVETVYKQLKNAHPHMQVYRKGEVPEKYHYNDYKFIQPIIGILDLGWSATTHPYFDSHSNYPSKGTHGFDPDYKEMNAIFYGKGPAFKKGTRLPVVQNTNIYELMCAILKITPAPNDGNLEVTKAVLKTN